MFKKKVIVLIFSHKECLNAFEIISLKQCYTILQHHEIRLTVPQTLDVKNYQKIIPNIKVDRFPDYFFTDIRQYNKLKISPLFYIKYKNYTYLLTYELDAFVFKDELELWYKKGFDYIGAPWFEGHHLATNSSLFLGVGNSGFSLRNLSKNLQLLKIFYIFDLIDKYKKYNILSILLRTPRIIRELISSRYEPEIVSNFYENEDYFWCNYLPEEIEKVKMRHDIFSIIIIKLFLKEYKIADYKNAMAFSFENLPDRLFELNNFKLPFGCHAWWRYDLEFWRPHIKKFGYKLPQNLYSNSRQ